MTTADFARAILGEKGIPEAFKNNDDGDGPEIGYALHDLSIAQNDDLDNELCNRGTTRDMLTRIMEDETWKGPVAEQYRREAKRRVDGGTVTVEKPENRAVKTVVKGAHAKHKPTAIAHRKVDADGLTALEREVLNYGKKTGADDLDDEAAIALIHQMEDNFGNPEGLEMLDPDLKVPAKKGKKAAKDLVGAGV
jgi:hypothetical protein